jgi:hypothetical protein
VRNPVIFQLVSHTLMRLVAPYLLVLLLASSLVLARGSFFYAAFALLQIFCWSIAVAALRFRIPVFHRFAAAASALLVLDAAAVAGLYKFLFTRGPLWKIWTSNQPSASAITAETENSPATETLCGPGGK